MKVCWTSAAQSDMRHIRHSVTCRSTEAAADALIDRIIARTTLLGTFPEMGRIKFKAIGVREITEPPYRIEEVEILMVFHASRAD